MRLLLDTCVIIDMLTDPDSIEDGVQNLLDDPQNQVYASFESARELIVHFNNKKLLTRQWNTATDVLHCVENQYEVEFLPLRSEIAHTYAHLRLNEAQEHRDPSDHVIISHAITEHLTLISSDTRFPFYRSQGLDLIEY